MLTASNNAKKLDREYKLSSSVVNLGKNLYSGLMSGTDYVDICVPIEYRLT